MNYNFAFAISQRFSSIFQACFSYYFVKIEFIDQQSFLLFFVQFSHNFVTFETKINGNIQ